jgi:hypothetical protein
MSKPWTGGCSCGEVRYVVNGEPAVMNHCHCRQCQRESGTGHGCHVTFVGSEFELKGDASIWESIGEGGMRKQRGFCGTCGAPVFIKFPDAPNVFVVSAASLDDPNRFAPKISIWTSAAPAWDCVDPKLESCPKMPSSAR